jgi:hypothetical protein
MIKLMVSSSSGNAVLTASSVSAGNNYTGSIDGGLRMAQGGASAAVVAAAMVQQQCWQ